MATAPSASLQPISRWTGEFVVPAVERAYREATYRTGFRQSYILAVIVLVIGWPIILTDHLNAAEFAYRWEILLVRLPMPLFLFLPVVTIMRNATYRQLDVLVLAFTAYMIIETFVLMHIFSGDLATMMARAVLFIILLNMVVMQSGRLRLAANVLSLPLIVSGVLLFSEGALETKLSLTTIMLASYMFGMAMGNWMSRLRRREYSRAQALTEANQALQKTQAELERSSNKKSVFVANISHELRTPLNAIIGFSEVLERETFGPLGHSKYNEYVSDVRRSGRHLLDLINDLLDLNRIESGKQEMKPEWVSLSDAMPDWVLLVREMARARGQDLVVPNPVPAFDLWVDVRALHQIMVNLLSNACKYAGDGCRMEIVLHQWPDGALRIGVADNGIGMDAETVSRVLEPFETAINYTSPGQQGWGMGIPLARNLAIANGLLPRVKSTPGAGTLFSVQFPPELVRGRHTRVKERDNPTRAARA